MPKLVTRSPRMCRDRHQAYVKINGHRVPLGKWGTPEAREAYDRLVAEWLSNGRKLPASTVDPAPEETTVTMVCVDYIKHARQKQGQSDLDHIEAALKLARKLYGSEPAESFGPKRLRIVRDQMIDAGLARSTINKRVKWIRRAFRWAASAELCSERVYRRLDTLDGLKRGEGGRETEKVRPVPRADVRRARRHMARPVRALVDLQLLTGARADELVKLKATDIDTGDKTVWTYKPTDHKTAYRDKERTIYFGPRAQKILRMFMQPGRALDKPLFSPREAHAEVMRRRSTTGKGRRPNQKPNPASSERTIGDQYVTASYRRAIHYACKRANVTQWGPHRLRHNAATFLRREHGIEIASIVLGHSSLAITQTYAEQNHKRAIEVMSKVG